MSILQIGDISILAKSGSHYEFISLNYDALYLPVLLFQRNM